MKVYVAGPITKGNQFINLRNAVLAGAILIEHGYLPYIPHLTCIVELVAGEREYEDWMKMDDAWLQCCNIVLRLDGESPGADREVVRAKELGIPVVFSHEIDWTNPRLEEAALMTGTDAAS